MPGIARSSRRRRRGSRSCSSTRWSTGARVARRGTWIGVGASRPAEDVGRVAGRDRRSSSAHFDMATSRISPSSWSLPVATLVGRAWICPWETSTVVAPPLQPPDPFDCVPFESTVTRPSMGGDGRHVAHHDRGARATGGEGAAAVGLEEPERGCLERSPRARPGASPTGRPRTRSRPPRPRRRRARGSPPSAASGRRAGRPPRPRRGRGRHRARRARGTRA